MLCVTAGGGDVNCIGGSVIMDTWWKRRIQVLKGEGEGVKAAGKAVGGSEGLGGGWREGGAIEDACAHTMEQSFLKH